MEGYRRLFRWVYVAGQPRMMIIGVGAIIVINGFNNGNFGGAIPYGTLWVLACFTCRMVSYVLPTPAADRRSSVPKEKPLPKAALAVSITELALPDACPGRDEMTAALPEHIRALIR